MNRQKNLEMVEKMLTKVFQGMARVEFLWEFVT